MRARGGAAWTKAAAEMEENYPIRASVGGKPTELAEERDLGERKEKRGSGEGSRWLANGEGAIITVLITIDHRLLARALSEGGDRRRRNCGWRRKSKACLKPVLETQ